MSLTSSRSSLGVSVPCACAWRSWLQRAGWGWGGGGVSQQRSEKPGCLASQGSETHLMRSSKAFTRL
jgi:hypothetical protein